jgi:DNA-binding NarL/FixJ family response regulator
MSQTIRVAILEDHPAIADGYKYYLQDETDIQLVATIEVGEELPKLLATQGPIHVLILDVGVPTSQTNGSPYPILYLMPLLLQKNPEMNILVISMHKEHALIKALIDAGASGYVFKDDRETLMKFSSVIRMVASGGIYFSRDAHKTIMRQASGGQVLSPRQLEVLSLSAAYPEKSTAELADLLAVANATVRNTLSVIYLRLGVRGRTAAMAKAREMGLIADVRPSYPLIEPIVDALGDPSASVDAVY